MSVRERKLEKLGRAYSIRETTKALKMTFVLCDVTYVIHYTVKAKLVPYTIRAVRPTLITFCSRLSKLLRKMLVDPEKICKNVEKCGFRFHSAQIVEVVRKGQKKN